MKSKVVIGILVLVGLFSCALISVPANADANEGIRVFVNGKEVISEDAPPIIINNRTMLPIRAVSEALGMDVKWDDVNRTVIITSPQNDTISYPDLEKDTINYDTPILGEAVATSEQLREVLKKNNPNAPDLIDLYLNIGKEYGVRGDLAFCQAAKETGWWRFGGLVKPEQNNYCGLGATGRPATGDESLNGANPHRVWFIKGHHGAYFRTPADGVEAHIQHLYAYATENPLPDGKEIVDPRFTLVTRGIAPKWIDLNGRWAVPGSTYGQSIISDYFGQVINIKDTTTIPTNETEIEKLKRENALLKAELNNLKNQLNK